MRERHGLLRQFRSLRLPALWGVLAPLLVLAGASTSAAAAGPMHLLSAIPVPVAAGNSARSLYSWGTSFVDQTTRKLFVADRSNAAIDVIDTRTGKLTRRISASPPFAGARPDPDRSGPNAVVASGRWVVASGAGDRIVLFNGTTGRQVSQFFFPDIRGVSRAERMAFDPKDNVLFVIIRVGAHGSPAGWFILVDPVTGKLTSDRRLRFDVHHGVAATNGIGQPVWDGSLGRFFVAVPEIGGDGGSGLNGGVASYLPNHQKLISFYPMRGCQPVGLALDPTTDQLLAHCRVVFDAAGSVWSGLDKRRAIAYDVILDAETGRIRRTVPGAAGGGEAWYNSGDDHFYAASPRNPLTPYSVVPAVPPTASPRPAPLTVQGAGILSVIDATSLQLDQRVPTFNVPAIPGVHGAAAAHSVAADATNGEVFVPLAANNVIRGCNFGCVAVYGRTDNATN